MSGLPVFVALYGLVKLAIVNCLLRQRQDLKELLERHGYTLTTRLRHAVVHRLLQSCTNKRCPRSAPLRTRPPDPPPGSTTPHAGLSRGGIASLPHSCLTRPLDSSRTKGRPVIAAPDMTNGRRTPIGSTFVCVWQPLLLRPI